MPRIPTIPPPKMLFLGTHRDMVPDARSCLECWSMPAQEAEEDPFASVQGAVDLLRRESRGLHLHHECCQIQMTKTESVHRPFVMCLSKSEGSKPVHVPLRWQALYQKLLEVMVGLGKKVLPREQCRQVAESMKIDDESCEEALNFFHGLNMLFYFPAILPNLVFIEPQMLLDKLSEVVDECLLHHDKGKKQEPMGWGDAEVS